MNRYASISIELSDEDYLIREANDEHVITRNTSLLFVGPGFSLGLFFKSGSAFNMFRGAVNMYKWEDANGNS